MDERVNEDRIREEVCNDQFVFAVSENWLTPAGRERKAPVYEARIANEYLGVQKVVKGRSHSEVDKNVRRQFQAWVEKEIRQRVSDAKNDLTEQAQLKSEKAREEIDAIRQILHATLTVDDRIDWSTLIEKREFQPTEFTETIPRKPQPPTKTLLQRIIPPISKRIDREYAKQVQQWQADGDSVAQRRKDHAQAQQRARATLEEAKRKKNEAIRSFRAEFEEGGSDAIKDYMRLVFERSSYPDGFPVEHELQIEPRSNVLVVDVSLPAPDAIPQTFEVKTADRNTRLKPVAMKAKDHAQLFDSAVKQTVLRTLHEAFEALYTPHVQSVVVNGWTTVTNRGTGHDETSCIISVSAERDEFEAMRLARVDPTECIKSLKGLVAGPLAQIAPVKPILHLDTSDPRFVESNDVLADFNSETNLAEISWEDFEHLVRELFGKLFHGAGAEVKITQASRDAGVDAIAFDPDPIRGGKFVIQAKRYTKVVPVSAVRDLYGTMINEGAAKGILVTTSYYGNDSRAFAKDKPITLIDGSNLVYLLEEHGHKVRIDLDAARANRLREESRSAEA